MEFVQRYWTQVQEQLGYLNTTQKFLIGSLVVILLLVLWLVASVASAPEMMPITRFAADREAEVLSRLQASGIRVSNNSGQIMVRQADWIDAMVVLESSDLMRADTSAAFDELIANQSPWKSNAQSAQEFQLAKQKFLGAVIGKMNGIRQADVVISMPTDQGFGRTAIRPSASVQVQMQGRRSVNRPLVEAVAGVVAGAVAEMTPQDVVVIDANRGMQFTVKDADSMPPGETLELVQKLESYHRNKIKEMLAFIPGVIVAVNVQTDSVLRETEEKYLYMEGDQIGSEFSRTEERNENQDAGEAGARPNTGMSIAGGGDSGFTETVEETRNEFMSKPLVGRTHTKRAGQTTQKINVTVNVPRDYFVSFWQQANPTAQAAPDTTMLQPVIDDQLAEIVSMVQPQISAESDGVVRAHMIPAPAQIAGLDMAGTGSGVWLVDMASSQYAQPIWIGTLALAALAMMLHMVRKATRQDPMPSIEELAGVPPTLPGEDDLVGEVDESPPSMQGQELTDDELRVRKVADEISELIKADPTEAANLFNKWVRTEE